MILTITTNRGQTFIAKWAWEDAEDEILRMEIVNNREISEIAHDFEGLTKISRKSESEGDAEYVGYEFLNNVQVNRKNGTAILYLKKTK